MPNAIATNFYTVDQVMQWMKDNLNDQPQFGFQYIDFGDPDDLIPGFPAVIITDNPTERRLHSTHTYLVNLSIDLWVLHADGTISSAQRRIEDIQLCNQIQSFLDEHITLDGNIIQGWVSARSPGLLTRKGALIIATRMTWDGIAQERFR